MASIKVEVKDKKTLVLLEDAKKGDIIELDKIETVDSSFINELITEQQKEKTDALISEARKEEQAKLQADKAKITAECQTQVTNLKEANTKELNKLKDEISEKLIKIANLQNAIKQFKSDLEHQKEQKETEIKLKEQEAESKYSKELNDAKNTIERLNQVIKSNDEKHKLDIEAVKKDATNDSLKQINELNEKHFEETRKLQDEIDSLKRSKAALNVKEIGEDLEVWCDREVNSYMQNGFTNCTWDKDNTVVKEEDEFKGSKADFIFKVFADDTHTGEPLTSACLDMKDENPDSKNKKSNSDYYAQLDKNRKKKGCYYAVLVSNLETDKSNDIPIFKVTDPKYPNMYVVRPAYLMTFLNMITSLTTRFVKLINDSNKKAEELKNYNEVKAQFDQIKNTYLDKPLASLSAEIENISKQNNGILEANSKIKNACDKINGSIEKIKNNYIAEIENKLGRFDLKLQKAYDKLV